MHELSLIESLLDQLHYMKKEHGLEKITVVHLGVGEISGVDLSFFRSTYDLYIPQTEWSHLSVNLTLIPWRVRCRGCGWEQKVEDWNKVCGRCGSEDTETIEGQEFLIQRIEGESHV